MEHEEREDIPWSSLVAHVEDGSDRRWYIIGVGIAVVVLAFAGVRFLGTAGSPALPSDPAGQAPSSTSTTVQESSLVVAESDLTEPRSAHTIQVVTRAEWFVADFFTVDGSDATVSALRSALADELRDVDLPHSAAGAQATFVEWAKAVAVRTERTDVYEVDVAYRAIRAVGDGFERDAVRFVTVGVAAAEGVPRITTLPVPTDPWTG